MTTIIQGRLPTADFVLEDTFDSVRGYEFDCVRLVENRLSVSLPFITVRGPSRSALEDAFESDRSIADYSLLAKAADEWLYRMEWTIPVDEIFVDLLGDDAVMLDAYANSTHWLFRILYPDRTDVSLSMDSFRGQGFSFDIHRVKKVDTEFFARNGLTEKQVDALLTAWQTGYFDVPRQIDLEELAEQMGISHQALSERLRRGHSTLIEETLAETCQSHQRPLRTI